MFYKIHRQHYDNELAVDCANGVGFVAMEDIIRQVRKYLNITLYNVAIEKVMKVNENCGAEYVHKSGKKPTGMLKVKKHAALDGDADRLIYFKIRLAQEWPHTDTDIIDGDKQFALFMLWIREKLVALGLEDVVSHVLIQTAYANASSGRFLESKNIPRVIVPTGVKYATPEQKKYTIGANCEPNGHGTILVDWNKLEEALDTIFDKEDINAKKLRAFLKIPSQTVGDGIANILMMEAVMRDMDLSQKYVQELY